MKTEQEKYVDALHKIIDLKMALDDLTPESKERLFREVLGIAGIQQYLQQLQNRNE